MIINGKKISGQVEERIRKEVKKFSTPITLIVFSAGNNAANISYIQRKKLFAERVGITLKHVKLPTTSTAKAKEYVQNVLTKEQPDAAILQIPVTKNLDVNELVASIPAKKDVDCLGKGNTYFHSPVILSIEEILRQNKISPRGKTVVVVGQGRLVGKPAAKYFKSKKARVIVCDEYTKDIPTKTKTADILVSGAGAANIITKDMVKSGVVALDVGFSQKEGKIFGDIDKTVAQKAAVFSGVPGGIGGMTVAYLFSNVIEAKKLQNKAKN